MKTILLLSIALGACAAGSRKAAAPAASSAEPAAAAGAGDPRAELDALDAEITTAMAKLGVDRPAPPPNTCVAQCDPERMSTAAAAAVAVDTLCKPAKSTTCTDTCTLKDSICKSAGRICELAAQLGGTDAYANEKCNRGTASCEAAKQRCCSCM